MAEWIFLPAALEETHHGGRLSAQLEDGGLKILGCFSGDYAAHAVAPSELQFQLELQREKERERLTFILRTRGCAIISAVSFGELSRDMDM
jgi:hypothetical protein